MTENMNNGCSQRDNAEHEGYEELMVILTTASLIVAILNMKNKK